MRNLLTSLFLASTLVLAASCKDPAASAPGLPAEGAAAQGAKKGVTAEKGAAELDPSKATEKAPEVFKAKFTTTKGDFVIEVHRDWAPQGADRFYNLVKMGFYNEDRFFRAVEGFMVQFGLHGLPEVNRKWQSANIPDDPVKQSNKKGYVTFAMRGLGGTRTTQIFINYADNGRLDGMGFAPFGQVVEGMDVVDRFYKGYGEGAPKGQGPDQGRIQSQGNEYLQGSFPMLDWVKVAQIVN
jgi:peptidyl-prolyl cis-trans isomerase A (cyclophilin A)